MVLLLKHLWFNSYMFGVDLSPSPIFKYAMEKNIIPQGDGDKKLWLAGNENRDVEVKKVLLEGSPFKSDYTPTELKNKALENIHKELQALQKLINSGIASEKTMMEYKKKYAEAKALSEEIKRGDGMPIPLPSELKKVPKAKEM